MIKYIHYLDLHIYERRGMNPYEILGLSPTADSAAIRKAHRRLIRLKHPDTNSSPNAAEEFRAIQEAYETIRRCGFATCESRPRQQRAEPTAPRQDHRRARSHTPPPRYDSAFKQRSTRGSERAQKLNENQRMYDAALKERNAQREAAQSVYDAELRKVDKLLRKRQEANAHAKVWLLEEANQTKNAATQARDNAFARAQEQFMKTSAEVRRQKDEIFKEYADVR